MDPSERLEGPDPGNVLAAAFAVDPVDLDELLLHRRPSDARAQEQVGREIVGGPAGADGRVESDHRDQHAEPEVGVCGDVAHDAGHAGLPGSGPGIDLDRLSERVFLAEELRGERSGQHDASGVAEARPGVALDQGERKDFEERRLGDVDLGLLEGLFFVLDGRVLDRSRDLGDGLDLGIAVPDRLGQDGRRPELVDARVAFVRPVGRDPVDAVGFLMEPVIAELVDDVKRDEDRGRDPHGQAEDVEEGIPLVLEKVPGGHFQVILEHSGVSLRSRPVAAG